jgi:hypothetical protein
MSLNLLVVLLAFNTSIGFLPFATMPAIVKSTLFTNSKTNMSAYFRYCYGNASILSPNIVIGNVVLPESGSDWVFNRCRAQDIRGWAREVSKKPLYLTAVRVTNIVMITPLGWSKYAVGCSAGVGDVGPIFPYSVVHIQASAWRYLGMWIHELGHNLGLNHAGYNGNDYGDGTSIMGACCNLRCVNAAQRYQMNWFKFVNNISLPILKTRALCKNLSVPVAHSSLFLVRILHNGSVYYINYRTRSLPYEDIPIAYSGKFIVYIQNVDLRTQLIDVIHVKKYWLLGAYNLSYLNNTLRIRC